MGFTHYKLIVQQLLVILLLFVVMKFVLLLTMTHTVVIVVFMRLQGPVEVIHIGQGQQTDLFILQVHDGV